MNRSAKRIFLILSSCIICMHTTNATSNLPPLPISDNAPVVTQTTDKSALNTAQEAPEAVNIDQFISDVDKKITEKAATDGVEDGELQSTNSDKITDDTVAKPNNSPNLTTEESKANTIPVATESLVTPINESPQEVKTTVTEQQIAPTSTTTTTNTAEPSITPPVNNQPDTQDKNIKTTGPVNSTPVVSEEGSANNAVSPAINNPGLLVPAYDSEAAKSEQPSPDATKIISNNNQQVATTAPDSFISDELTVILDLAPDDIAVGSLTKEAYLDQLSFPEYSDIFWKKYYESQRVEQRKVIDLFINDYDKKFNQ
jgi:hypothetical protein